MTLDRMTGEIPEPVSQTVPWGLLARLGEGSLTGVEIDALLPVFEAGTVQPPEWFIARAAKIPAQQAAQAERAASAPRRRILGTIIAGAGGGMQLLPVREAVQAYHQMLLTAGPFLAHLEVRDASDGTAAVAGLIISPEWDAHTVELHAKDEDAGAAKAAAPCSALGFFSMTAGHGTYTLVIRGQNEDVEFLPLSI